MASRIEPQTDELSRRMEFARQRAALAWCQPGTKKLPMDPALAEEFAELLVGPMYEPHLGCATTRMLLDELAARSDLSYSTVPQLEDGDAKPGSSATVVERRALAEHVVDTLCCNGAGERASRLVLELPDGRDGGGWGRLAAIDAVAKVLRTLLPG